jgi:ABC-2 type transport system permease protein
VIGSFLAMLDMGARFQGIDNALINWLSLSTHLEPFLFGLVASVDIVYFLLLTTLALLFAGRRLDGLRAHG